MVKKVYIIGHRNPDTDAIVAATAYAELKHMLGKKEYMAVRAGHLSPQTEYVFKRFNVEPPKYISELRPKTEFYMRDTFTAINQESSLWTAMDKLVESGEPLISIVDEEGRYKGILNYNAFALNSVKILNPKRNDIFTASLHLIERTLNATPVVEFDPDEKFNCSIMVGDDDVETFRLLLEEHKSENIIVITGDRQDIQKLCIEFGVRALIITKDYILPKELHELAKEKKVSVLVGHDSTMTTAMLIEYSAPVIDMADKTVQPVHPQDTVQKIRPLLAQSPNRCLPVVDDDNKVIGVISETDLLQEPNIQVILVDHNEPSQAIEGIEHYVIQEIIDHHRVNTFTTRYPITLINKPVGSTSTIISNMFRENRLPIPKHIAALLLCGILSDTLILQSATTTEYDVLTAEYLSTIVDIDLQSLGNDIIRSGSHIGNRKALEVIRQDMKDYSEGKVKYTVSQIEVDSTSEILKRKQEFLDELEAARKSAGNLFNALLVTDITQLSSLMFLASDSSFEQVVNLPKQDEHIYYMQNIVSRKKQLIPLLTDLLSQIEE